MCAEFMVDLFSGSFEFIKLEEDLVYPIRRKLHYLKEDDDYVVVFKDEQEGSYDAYDTLLKVKLYIPESAEHVFWFTVQMTEKGWRCKFSSDDWKNFDDQKPPKLYAFSLDIDETDINLRMKRG